MARVKEITENQRTRNVAFCLIHTHTHTKKSKNKKKIIPKMSTPTSAGTIRNEICAAESDREKDRKILKTMYRR